MRKYEPRNKPIQREPSERRKSFSYELPSEDQLFYKYQKPSLHSLYSLAEKYFWFSLREDLNDPHEMRIKCQETASDEEIVGWAKRLVELGEYKLVGGKDNLENIINDVDGAIEDCRSYWFRSLNANLDKQDLPNKMFCVSEDCSSSAMWAHYTENHTGWVVGFDPASIFHGMPLDGWFKVRYKKISRFLLSKICLKIWSTNICCMLQKVLNGSMKVSGVVYSLQSTKR